MHTPEEVRKLADTEKEIAIDLLNKMFKIEEGFENANIRIIVEKIINASLLYAAELQSTVLNNRSSTSVKD